MIRIERTNNGFIVRKHGGKIFVFETVDVLCEWLKVEYCDMKINPLQ